MSAHRTEGIEAIAALAPVIPVLTIDRLDDAVPLGRALVKGGLPVLEITLRTATALEAVRQIVANVPGAVVGVGTVLTPLQMRQAREAGAGFAVSPGCTDSLADAAAKVGMAYLPGIQTVSEAMALSDKGYRFLKFFPADAAGGVTWLKAVAPPLAGLRFCPTGGIGEATAPSYLELANVACVGGSWVAPKEAVIAQDWSRIERLAAAASALKRR